MVVPIADAYYESEDPENAGADRRLMSKTASKIKRNMKWLKNYEGKLSPKKFYMFTSVPKRLIAVGLPIRLSRLNLFESISLSVRAQTLRHSISED